MFEAAKLGNNGFLDIIWEKHPDVMFEEEESHYSIFHIAVMYRQNDIFSFMGKKVRRMLRPVDAEAPNKDGKTASALFTEEHEGLRKKAEKWTKGVANACIVEATLIATVAFTAGLTVPGGTKEQNGTPHFVQRASLIIFAISDTAALLFSSFSMVDYNHYSCQ
ncbi:uncharacterized protein LOC123219762 [Mangifera indica]|uniref:uncharacterized protein LOC123219762 n=1 Tax=Mangifera indica TaxID=29780 RepID=UPI001CFC304D|nr:uncharacterized protein LOC123219762 [Mangifera indica]